MFKNSIILFILALFLAPLISAEESSLERRMFEMIYGNELPTPSGKFRFYLGSDRPDLVEIVEKAFIDIANTPTGKKMCQIVTANGEPSFLAYFGVSQKAYDSLLNTCGPSGWASIFKQPRAVGMNLGGSRFNFLITPSDGPPPPLSGWTSGAWTLISLRDKESSLEIYRIVAHEFSQIADFKRYFTQNGQLRLISAGDAFCQTAYAISDPAIKLAFSALRAFQGENQIMKDLNQLPISLGNSKTCLARVSEMIPRVRPFTKALLVEQAIDYLRLPECGTPKNLLSVEESLETISRATIKKSGDEKQPLCEYFESLEVEAPESYTRWPVANGPRPRISDGGGD